MNKYPSIEQFRHAIQSIKHKIQLKVTDDGVKYFDESIPLPSILYRGTVKTHGTHGDIVFDPTAEIPIKVQSRNNILSSQRDNSGFYSFVNSIPISDLMEFLKEIEVVCSHHQDFKFPIIISGEWCGKGIQKGVGISELQRFFIFYNVSFGSIEDSSSERTWVDIDAFPNIHLEEYRIFNIMDFTSYTQTIDFSHPETAIDELKRITDDVERNCPVAKRIAALDDVYTRNTTGEGVVWIPISEEFKSSRFWFKVKGDEHRVTKEGIVLAPEKVRTIKEFLNKTVTVNRLEQGYITVQEDHNISSKKFNNAFVQWILNDIMKEEYDTMEASKIEKNDISNQINKRAIKWVINKKCEVKN